MGSLLVWVNKWYWSRKPIDSWVAEDIEAEKAHWFLGITAWHANYREKGGKMWYIPRQLFVTGGDDAGGKNKGSCDVQVVLLV